MRNNKSLFVVLWLLPFMIFAQIQPAWLDANIRNAQYPTSVFFTGFASGNEPLEQVKTAAQTSLTENLRVVVSSNTTAITQGVSSNERYDELNIFSSVADKTADAEIVGMKVESYTDPKTRTNFAFAYVNKYELIGYYKSNLSVNFGQIESFVKTAQDLEANTEKAKARRQLEQAKPIFEKVRYAQDLLTAIDPNISASDLQQAKTEQFYNTLIQMQARLEQGVFVYVESVEDLFGAKVNIVTDKLKAELAKNGCSFVDNAEQADFVLKINAATREFSKVEELIFCYADVQVELIKTQTDKTLYQDLLAQKSGHTSAQNAGRNALETAAPEIMKKLLPWVKE